MSASKSIRSPPSSLYSQVKIEPGVQPETQEYKNSHQDEQSFHNKSQLPPRGNILHVTNIHPQLTYEQIKQGLYNLFSPHGAIYEITIKTKQNGSHFAFVDYPNIYDAEKAMIASKKQGKLLQDQELRVNYCEDPKKNQARKSQKCFLCLGTGHKARNCPVKPQLIKPKKKIPPGLPHSSNQYRQQKHSVESFSFSKDQPQLMGYRNNKRRDYSQLEYPSQFYDQNEYESEQQSQQSQNSSDSASEVILSTLNPKRDKDYLRFLKLKKKLLQNKMKKKIIKSKRKKL